MHFTRADRVVMVECIYARLSSYLTPQQISHELIQDGSKDRLFSCISSDGNFLCFLHSVCKCIILRKSFRALLISVSFFIQLLKWGGILDLLLPILGTMGISLHIAAQASR